MDIDTRDEGSGVRSVDLLYQISEGNGKSVVAILCIPRLNFVFVPLREIFQFSNCLTSN